MVAIAGLGLAAAAGAMIFVSVRDQAAAPERAEQASGRADVARNASPAAAVAVSSSPAGAQPPMKPSETAASGSAAVTSEPAALPAGTGSTIQGAADDPIAEIAPATKGAGKPVPSYASKKSKGSPTAYEGKTEPVKPIGRDAGASSQDRGKQAGVPLKLGKAKLDQQSLSNDDIQRGMRAVAPNVQACSAGTPGLATVQLTVAPSGQVQKVTVSGPFAGTPVARCVERAAAAATFPAWDGEPATFRYDYFLSD